MYKISLLVNNFLQIFLSVIILSAFAAQSHAQRVVGYTTSWLGSADQIDYGSLTHINYAFAIPTANGGLEPVANASKLVDVVNRAHSQGVKVLIAIGGWELGDGGGNDNRFNNLASTAAGRTNFVNSVLSLIDQYNLDGADIDWEHPEPVNGAPDANYTALMSALSGALHSRGLLLTAAVVAEGWTADGIDTQVFSHVDWLNIMAYDGGDGANHSPYSYAQSALNYWKGRGLAQSKAVIGVPFYSRPGWYSYSSLLSMGADPNADYFNGEYYNGISTIQAKTQLGTGQGSGVMIWSIDHDVQGGLSLLKAIHDEGGDGDPAPGDTIKVQAERFSGMSGVEVESVASADGGQSVGYIDTGDWMAFSNIAIPASGYYTVEYRVASLNGGGQLSLDLNAGSIVLGYRDIGSTGDWFNWTTVSHSVYIDAGTYSFGIYAQSGGWNLDWFSITPP